jgi:hypothetical protein
MREMDGPIVSRWYLTGVGNYLVPACRRKNHSFPYASSFFCKRFALRARA